MEWRPNRVKDTAIQKFMDLRYRLTMSLLVVAFIATFSILAFRLDRQAREQLEFDTLVNQISGDQPDGDGRDRLHGTAIGDSDLESAQSGIVLTDTSSMDQTVQTGESGADFFAYMAAVSEVLGLTETRSQEMSAVDSGMLGQASSLHPDLFGWVSIDGTVIDYPVMHTPGDPEYYLHRGLDGEYSFSGVPFMAGDCFTGCGNYILYAHHMKNGTMFKALTYYGDEGFYKDHPYVNFNTLERSGIYEVFAAFYTKAGDASDPEVFRFYDYFDLRSEAVFNEYVAKVKSLSVLDTDIIPVHGEELLTLSTCSYHTDDGRFVVVARRIG